MDRIFNGARDVVLTQEQRLDRDRFKAGCEMIKLAAIVSAFSGLFFFVIFPNIFTAVLALTIAFGAKETYSFTENILEMLKNARVEVTARSSRENLVAQLSKNTLVTGMFINCIAPALDEIVYH